MVPKVPFKGPYKVEAVGSKSGRMVSLIRLLIRPAHAHYKLVHVVHKNPYNPCHNAYLALYIPLIIRDSGHRI